jgi:hypothetical protein
LDYKLSGYKQQLPLQKEKRRTKNSWDKLMTTLEHGLYKTKPNTYNILKHVNKQVKQTANIKGGTDENTFLHYYKQLWNIQNFTETKAK